jgi:hypothetical protein
MFSEQIELRGHIIDSLILPKVPGRATFDQDGLANSNALVA